MVSPPPASLIARRDGPDPVGDRGLAAQSARLEPLGPASVWPLDAGFHREIAMIVP
jgi:hypothetical protein